MTESFILFEIAGAAYAVPSGQVEMVEMIESITRVPNAPDFLEGVTAVRGQMIPVISMRRRFHMESVAHTLRTRLIIIRLGERRIGMLVDSAREFLRVPVEQIQPPPETLSGPFVHYLDGVINRANRLILIVNLPRLFRDDEQAALQENTPATADVSSSAA